MARYAIVDQNNRVVNVVIWDGSEWLPPRNHSIIPHDSANVGDDYDPATNTIIKNIIPSSDLE